MNEQKHTMISKAVDQFVSIYPPKTKRDLQECFTTEGDMLIFWFNTSDETTHVLTATIL